MDELLLEELVKIRAAVMTLELKIAELEAGIACDPHTPEFQARALAARRNIAALHQECTRRILEEGLDVPPENVIPFRG